MRTKHDIRRLSFALLLHSTVCTCRFWEFVSFLFLYCASFSLTIFIGKSWRNSLVKKWESQTKLQKVGLISRTLQWTLHSKPKHRLVNRTQSLETQILKKMNVFGKKSKYLLTSGAWERFFSCAFLDYFIVLDLFNLTSQSANMSFRLIVSLWIWCLLTLACVWPFLGIFKPVNFSFLTFFQYNFRYNKNQANAFICSWLSSQAFHQMMEYWTQVAVKAFFDHM